MSKKILLSCWILSVLACSPSSPKLEAQIFAQRVDTGELLEFNPKVDILFVVDDSGSMSGHQLRLSKNVDSIVDSINKSTALDYHIGVITSTLDHQTGTEKLWCRLVSKPGEPRFVDRSTPRGLDLLKEHIVVGSMGDTTEKFFMPVEVALTDLANTYNAGFLRKDASLVLIFITDTDDQSLDKKRNPYSSAEFYDFLLKLKDNNLKKVIPYGIVIPSGATVGGDCSRDEFSPVKLEDVITRFSGYVYDLCDANYNSNLNFLGKDIASRASKYMYLNRRPIPSTIEVNFGNQKVPNDLDFGWTFDAEKNAIVFGDRLMESLSGKVDKLEISYSAVPE